MWRVDNVLIKAGFQVEAGSLNTFQGSKSNVLVEAGGFY